MLLLFPLSAFSEHYQVIPIIKSDSFSNVLPIKQLVDDEWRQAPTDDASNAFTQNEIGIEVKWLNWSFNLAKRFDYFLYTNNDTAKAFYLERTDQALTTQSQYNIDLKLHHQQSKGLRVGYSWNLNDITTTMKLGYWEVTAVRESQIQGEVWGDEKLNLYGVADITESYSQKNFLKRPNNGDWETNGWGSTLDFAIKWQVSDSFILDLDLIDIFSHYELTKLGYSHGKVDTQGTFINSVGGKSYLPLYKGVEKTQNSQFRVPKIIDLIGLYKHSEFSYFGRYKQQAKVNFYYIGIEKQYKGQLVRLSLDIKHLSPEIEIRNNWLQLRLAMDEIKVEKAMQLSFSISVNYSF
jgi:hypothetical protein